MVDDDTWPPEQPKSFTPLLLIHYQGHRTPEQVTAMAELTCTSNIHLVTSDQSGGKPAKLDNLQKLLDANRATKEIEEILAPLEETTSFILIEGAPGIANQSC